MSIKTKNSTVRLTKYGISFYPLSLKNMLQKHLEVHQSKKIELGKRPANTG